MLEATGICKSFGHVEVLRDVDFEAEAGQVTALIGDNGAGKSTLVKILSGALSLDRATITLEGEPVTLASPTHARDVGIETVYQDLALAPELGPAENTFAGRELLKPGLLGKLGVLDKKAMRKQAGEAFRSMGTDVKDLDAAVGALSGGQKQSVAICRSVMWAKKVIFMDEPTAALGVRQTGKVLELVRRVADEGVAVVLISHNMPEVLEVADRIQVLRLGKRVAQYGRDATVDQLVGAMTGALELIAVPRHRRRGGAAVSQLDVGRPPSSVDAGRADQHGFDPAAAATLPPRRPAWQRMMSTSPFYMGCVLLALIIVFSILEPDSFPTVANFRNITARRGDAAGHGRRHDVRDGRRRVRHLDRLGARVLRRRRLKFDGGRPDNVVTVVVGLVVCLLAGLAWGLFNGFCIAKLQGAAADHHARHARRGARRRPADHARQRRAHVPTTLFSITRYRPFGLSWLVWVAIVVIDRRSA